MNTELIEKYHMLPGNGRVLCAVSGGADSMCLLHFLWINAEALGIEVFAAHFDHQLRGLESARDRTFVKDWCGEKGIPCTVGFGKVREYAVKNSMGIEEAARKLRYEFLEKTAAELNCGVIATAHNACDNAETVLMNLTRGAGLCGMGGIPPVRGRIIRPLLGADRAQILEYLDENRVPHVEDSTNASDDYVRNSVRHKVIPALEEINPAFTENVFRASQLAREDEEYLDSLAEKFITDNLKNDSLPIKGLRALPAPVSSRVLRRMSARPLEKRHIAAMMSLMEGTEAASADIPGMRVTAERGRLYFGAAREVKIASVPLNLNCSTPIPEAGMTIRTDYIENCGEINSSFSTFYFKYENICGNIFCTCRRDGDKIRLVGRGCSKSLKDLFAEKGYTKAQKDLTPVLRDDKGVLAVYGFGVAEGCAAQPGDTVLRVIMQKDGDTDNA